jgi:hypothetical protein
VKPEVALKPAEDSKLLTWKFGRNRGEHLWEVTIGTENNQSLAGVRADQIAIDTAPLDRADKSEQLPKPTFTAPRITTDQKRIRFAACVNANGGKPGSYNGSLAISGPVGVTGTTMSINVTLKERPLLFGGIELVVLLVTLVALAAKALGDYKKAEYDNVPADTLAKKKWKWWVALTYNWRSPAGIVTSLVAIIVTVGGAYLLYHKAETWGADLTPDLLAIGSSALTAVGIQGGLGGIVDAVKAQTKS